MAPMPSQGALTKKSRKKKKKSKPAAPTQSRGRARISSMRRRTQIVLAITFMVAALVSGASYIYISQMLHQRITAAHDTAMYLTSQLAFLATNAAPDLSSTRVDTIN